MQPPGQHYYASAPTPGAPAPPQSPLIGHAAPGSAPPSPQPPHYAPPHGGYYAYPYAPPVPNPYQHPPPAYGYPPGPYAPYPYQHPPPAVYAYPAMPPPQPTACSPPIAPPVAMAMAAPSSPASVPKGLGLDGGVDRIFGREKVYKMKDKWFSMHEGAKITDTETGATPFTVRAVPQQRGHEVELLGPQGCVVYIDEKRLTLTNKYKLFARAKVGPELATITQEFSFTTIKFEIEIPGAPKGSPKLHMKGDYYAREFMLTRGTAVAAIISRQRGTSNGGFFAKLAALTQEEYLVRIAAGEDVAFMLACVIVVDKVCLDEHKGSHRR